VTGVTPSGDLIVIEGATLLERLNRIPSGNPDQPCEERKPASSLLVEKTLPDFATASRAPDTPVVTTHQDAFAANCQEGEYRLIGMAIKFAGIR
jgi:hypothetical protein